MTGDTADISHPVEFGYFDFVSEVVEFGYFDLVWFISPGGTETVRMKDLRGWHGSRDFAGTLY